MNDIAKWLIIGGAILIAIGIFWQLFGKLLPLGRMPGDIVIERENMRIYFPIVTMLVVSIILSIILSIAGRFFR
jgi:amino acid permease